MPLSILFDKTDFNDRFARSQTTPKKLPELFPHIFGFRNGDQGFEGCKRDRMATHQERDETLPELRGNFVREPGTARFADEVEGLRGESCREIGRLG